MYCRSCGKNSPDTAGFCGSCGARLATAIPVDDSPSATSGKTSRGVLPIISVVMLSVVVTFAIYYSSRHHSIQATSNTHSASNITFRHYSVVDLGPVEYIEGTYHSLGVAISSEGTIADLDTDAKTAVSSIRYWKNGQWESKGTVSGYRFPQIIAINDHLQALCLGGSNNGGQYFLWSNGTVFPVGEAGTALSANKAFAINEAGSIVGASSHKAFLFRNGVLASLKTSIIGSFATAISNNGQIAGFVADESGRNEYVCHSYLWSNDKTTLIGSLPGKASSRPSSVNDKDEVVGNAFDTADIPNLDEPDRAFFWRSGVMTDLGSLGGSSSIAYCINNNSQIVGSTGKVGETKRAFLWQDGKMVDLNTLLPANSGWTLEEATGISDSGQIIGFGNYQKNFRVAFLLTPE